MPPKDAVSTGEILPHLELENMTEHDIEAACSIIAEAPQFEEIIPSKKQLTSTLRRDQVIDILVNLKRTLSAFNRALKTQPVETSMPTYFIDHHYYFTVASAQKAAEMAGWDVESVWRGNHFTHLFTKKGTIQRNFVQE